MKITAILETCLYAENLEETAEFYVNIVGLDPVMWDKGRHVFFRMESSMLLIFNPETTSTVPTSVGEDPVPMHGARGAGHVAFKVSEAGYDECKKWIVSHDIPIESEIAWPAGGKSFYFRDPAGNSLEIGTPKIWGFSS